MAPPLIQQAKEFRFAKQGKRSSAWLVGGAVIAMAGRAVRVMPAAQTRRRRGVLICGF
jgi:hypothetical protein